MPIDFELVRSINYWDEGPLRLGHPRESYLHRIAQYRDAHLLKVLVGQRRSGKSTILKQLIARLVADDVPTENILYLNFELYELHTVKNETVLAEIIKTYLSTIKPKGKFYLFLDEIQEVEGWEKIINSYLANDRYDCEIFLTGSNAHLLSTELATFVTGRYVEIPVFPFSFSEFLTLNALQLNRENFIRYLEGSGIPELYALKENEMKISYLTSLQDSILMNDVVKRFQVNNPKLLYMLLDFMIDNTGKLFSINAIVKKINSLGISANAVTISNYINYLERTFLVHCVHRYDLKGKKILEGERKYYLNDLGFINYLKSSFDNSITRKLENYVYLELIRSGYKVTVGNIHHLEIDFVAEKNEKTLYIQVCYLLHDEAVIKREYGNLEKIRDNWPKWVVTMDDVSFPIKNGIEHVHAWNLHDQLI